MASFAAASYASRMRGSGSGGIRSYYTGGGRTYTNNHINTLANLQIKKNAYLNAKKKYENQKRSVSGGFRGWINRRRFGNAGQQARQARNNQLNANLKRRMNNARNQYKKANSTGNAWKAKRWFNGLMGSNRMYYTPQLRAAINRRKRAQV